MAPRPHCDQSRLEGSPPKGTLSWWQAALLAPVLILVVPIVVVIALTAQVVATALLHIAIWLVWRPRGIDVLFVYSNSPNWQAHIEAEILPKITGRAVVMNWSERKTWKASLARFAFRHFGGAREFNPLGVVFRPWRRARVFRFWQPFRDARHGREGPLRKLEAEFFQALGERG